MTFILDFKAALTFHGDKQEKILSRIEENTESGPDILQRLKDIQRLLSIHPVFRTDATLQQHRGDNSMEDCASKTTPGNNFSSPISYDASDRSEIMDAVNDEDDEDRKRLAKVGSGIPEYHTSSVSRIVSWKSIQNVIGVIDPDYAMTAEENRSVLRPYSESQHASDKASHTLHGKIGAGCIHYTPTIAGFRISPPNNRPGMNGAPKLELVSSTMCQLLKNYKRHISIKYPILLDHELDSMAERFSCSINTPSTMSNGGIGRQGLKRKRSDDRLGVSTHTSTCSEVHRASIEHATFLVILALGDACGHNERINNPLQEHSSSHPVHFQSGYPSPEETDHPLVSSHGSAEKGVPQPLCNLAISQGLEYFTAATDIMGQHFGSDTLGYVQLMILASVYLGLSTQVSRCQAYLHEATRALRVVSRSKSTLFQQLAEEQKWGQEEDNPLLFAFWTCFQLESKNITELHFPHSGILSWAQHMPWPNGPAAIEAGMSKLQVDSYMVRLMLRKHTNNVMTDLYSPGGEETYKLPLDPKVERQLYRSIDALRTSLDKIPRLTSPETVHPSLAMLSDQLNAEIIFAQALTYRPCLKMVMNREIPFDQVPAKIIHSAKLCITAMQNGMKAFEGLKSGQSIPSDIWDIVHTQWGNASILQVAFRDEFLKKFINANMLMVHVRQTAEFLQQVAQISPALWQDLKILELIDLTTGFLR